MDSILKKTKDFILRLSMNPTDNEDAHTGRIILVGGNLLGIAYASAVGVYFFVRNDILGGMVLMVFVILSILGQILATMGKIRLRWWSGYMGLCILGCQFVLTIVRGGFAESGYSLPIWGLTAPLVALVTFKPRQAAYWMLGYLACVSAIYALTPYLPTNDHFTPREINFFTFTTIVLGSGFIFGFLIFFILQRNEALRLLSIEQEKSESLLLNILPQKIATQLKNEAGIIVNHFPSASILFADVVNFTPMSAQMTPNELVELLDEVFSRFDALVEKYGLEKIKTIGDCYMVAAGVPTSREDHAQALTLMALEIQDYVEHNLFRGKQIHFRIGINSGPVVAGVIGRKKFIYDLWGDTVNTASRMESHGVPGIIQITEATYNLIKNQFPCEPRGVITVKGKGEMKIWHVAPQTFNTGTIG